MKEQSAKLLGEVVSLTTPEALKPALNNVTGPLIRVFGDRFNLNVKVAILDALSLLLSKVSYALSIQVDIFIDSSNGTLVVMLFNATGDSESARKRCIMILFRTRIFTGVLKVLVTDCRIELKKDYGAR